MHRRRHPLARADRPRRHHHRHECLLRHRLHGRFGSYFCRGVGSGELFGYLLCLLSAFVASSLLTLCGRNSPYGAAPRNQPRLPSAGANFERHELLGLIVVSLGQTCLRLRCTEVLFAEQHADAMREPQALLGAGMELPHATWPDDLAQALGKEWPCQACERFLRVLLGLGGVQNILALERPFPSEHLVKNGPERPDVCPLVDGLPSGLLRRHIRRRSHDHADLGGSGGQRRGLTKALFMTVWCPDSRSVESNCGIPRG